MVVDLIPENVCLERIMSEWQTRIVGDQVVGLKMRVEASKHDGSLFVEWTRHYGM